MSLPLEKGDWWYWVNRRCGVFIILSTYLPAHPCLVSSLKSRQGLWLASNGWNMAKVMNVCDYIYMITQDGSTSLAWVSFSIMGFKKARGYKFYSCEEVNVVNSHESGQVAFSLAELPGETPALVTLGLQLQQRSWGRPCPDPWHPGTVR